MGILAELDAAALRLIAEITAAGVVPDVANRALARLMETAMVKTGPLVFLLVLTWLRPGPAGRGLLDSPERVTRTALGVLAALAAARTLQEGLPMQPRPRLQPGIAFPPLNDDIYRNFWDWSSMPSDHAVFAAALAAAVWVASWRLGLLAAAWAILVVCLPRIYFGLHYVSDVLVGLALGASIVMLAWLAPMPAAAWAWLGRLEERAPAVVILGVFLLGWQMIELFDSARQVVGGLARAMRTAEPDG